MSNNNPTVNAFIENKLNELSVQEIRNVIQAQKDLAEKMGFKPNKVILGQNIFNKLNAAALDNVSEGIRADFKMELSNTCGLPIRTEHESNFNRGETSYALPIRVEMEKFQVEEVEEMTKTVHSLDDSETPHAISTQNHSRIGNGDGSRD